MKKLYIVITIIISFILYIFLGIIISYKKQPNISDDYISSFYLEDYYSDDISCDRACIIEDNKEALIERLRMIEMAEERIILSTFDFRSDNSGKDILAALYSAAERGLDIKVLVDGFSAFLQMYGNEYFFALSTLDNVEIKIYNPINLLKPWKSMGRLHDKFLIVDNESYIIGGRNTFDYFLGDKGYKNYDRDVLVYNTKPYSKESSIYDLIDYFYKVWNLKECKLFNDEEYKGKRKKVIKAREELKEIYKSNIDKYPFLLEDFDYQEITYEVNKISLLSNPVHVYAKEPAVFYSLIQLMNNAKEEVKIHTPYIICNDFMYQAIRSVTSSGTKISIMTNSPANNGNPFGASDYIINRDKILQTGAKIYEYEGGISYHGKSITIDDNISIIGSFNMDLRSVYLSTETMVVIDSEEINKQLKEYFKTYEEDAVYIIDKDRIEIPKGVVRQEFTEKKKLLIRIISRFNWLRFLM